MSTPASLIAAYARDSTYRGLQPTTVERRTIQLRCFAAYVDRPLGDVTGGDVERFLASRSGHGGADIVARTRYVWLSNLGCFYRWAIRKELLERDPTARLDRPRLPRLLPRPISDADLAAAIAAADSQMRAMLLLASHGGLRCCELARMHANDVLDTAARPTILVHGKGGKDRTVPLHSLVQEAMRSLPRRGFLFRRPDGNPLSPAQVSIVIRDYLRGHGIDATAHQLRHWFATRVYQETLDLRLTQELMGHANPATTAIYTAFANADAAAAVEGIGLAPAT